MRKKNGLPHHVRRFPHQVRKTRKALSMHPQQCIEVALPFLHQNEKNMTGRVTDRQAGHTLKHNTLDLAFNGL
jgi:hypothetical protein